MKKLLVFTLLLVLAPFANAQSRIGSRSMTCNFVQSQTSSDQSWRPLAGAFSQPFQISWSETELIFRGNKHTFFEISYGPKGNIIRNYGRREGGGGLTIIASITERDGQIIFIHFTTDRNGSGIRSLAPCK